jgi:hypothetical protein
MNITHRGVRVPWITRWTSEVVDRRKICLATHNDIGGGYRIALIGETPDDRIDDVLWLPEGDGQGVGTPMWKDVHSHRQRRCMVEGLCQVCGEQIELPLLFLIPYPELMQKEGGKIITDVAPLCRTCLPIARQLCPAITKHEHEQQLLEVRGWRTHALFGDIIERGPTGTRLQQGEVPVGNADALRKIMARTAILELWDSRRSRL